MIPTSARTFVAVCIVSLLLAVPVAATPVPVVITGTVIGMNESAGKITLRAGCERFSCDYNVTGLFAGRVPDRSVLLRVQPGEVVEAVFKDWIFRITDPATGYVVPSDETRDIRQWYAVQRLAYGDDGRTLVATELFGDPGYVDTPLDAGYRVDYRLFGPAPQAYDFASFPRETVANLTVRKDPDYHRSAVLATGKSCRFSDTGDNSMITIQFTGGYDAGGMEAKACPCADYHIRVLSEKERTPLAARATDEPKTSRRAPADPVLPVLCTGLIAILLGIGGRRG
jgi:hypothetical protein